MPSKHTRRAALALALTLAATSAAVAQESGTAQMGMEKGTTMVGGQAMFRTRDIVDNAVNSADHTTLVAAVKAAGLVETLKGAGPYTVFAPTNAAFGLLPQGTVPTLLEPANKAQLTKVLTYHVVAGRYDAAALLKAIKSGHGQAMLKTVQGEPLTVMLNGDRNIVVRDAKGDVADISTYDVVQSNGVIHVVDKVLLPS
ncbi:MAG TPA: fasciclin domain-containing protein [Gemmatimonadales bacterium]|nr:fasciclin domain-containing protein [Gemmatimonadales bacterium]